MAKVIASMNQKGGVGKTMLAGLMAEWFALVRKKRVLLIDLDMQCNTTDQWVGMEVAPNSVGGQLPPKLPDYDPSSGALERSTIADIFYGVPVIPYQTWLTDKVSEGGYVDLMCGHPEKLEEVNIEFSKRDGQLDEKVHNRLKDFLSMADVQAEYDIILLDTGPSRNPVFRAAMRAADAIIIPFTPEEKDIQGINAMLQIVRQENYSRTSATNKLTLVGLLPNKVRTTKLHENNLATMSEQLGDMLFPQDAWLSLSAVFPERDDKDARPKSVFELAPGAKARVQATHMSKFVEKKVFGKVLGRNP